MTTSEADQYVRGIREENRGLLARAITLVESALPAHQALARRIVDGILPYTGNAVRLGITGVPGVGKSTFIESFGMKLVEAGHRVAVLAIDPSSSRSGGSVMADKTRMERLSVEPSAYIRPSPSGRTLGGVARKTRETMLLCEGAGFDVVIVETVGVGQSETAVASMTDFFLVLMLAGAGDELQGIKKGVLEMADAIAINKADGVNLEPAEKARKQYETALHFVLPASPLWTPPVLTVSARELTGIDEIWETVKRHRETLQKAGELTEKRRRQALDWMWTLVEDGLRERFHGHPAIRAALPKMTREVERGATAATVAANRLLELLDTPSGGGESGA